jgi:hypothetical protein
MAISAITGKTRRQPSAQDLSQLRQNREDLMAAIACLEEYARLRRTRLDSQKPRRRHGKFESAA